jgi:hypothetical protein
MGACASSDAPTQSNPAASRAGTYQEPLENCDGRDSMDGKLSTARSINTARAGLSHMAPSSLLLMPSHRALAASPRTSLLPGAIHPFGMPQSDDDTDKSSIPDAAGMPKSQVHVMLRSMEAVDAEPTAPLSASDSVDAEATPAPQ